MQRSQRSRTKARSTVRTSRSSSRSTGYSQSSQLSQLSSIASPNRSSHDISSRNFSTRSVQSSRGLSRPSTSSSVAQRKSLVTVSSRSGHHEATENPVFKKGIFSHKQFPHAPNQSHTAQFQHPMNYQGDVPVTPTEFNDLDEFPEGPIRANPSFILNAATVGFGILAAGAIAHYAVSVTMHPGVPFELLPSFPSTVANFIIASSPLPEVAPHKSFIDTQEFNRNLELFLDARGKASPAVTETIVEEQPISAPTSFPKIGVIAVDTPVDLVFSTTETEAKHDV